MGAWCGRAGSRHGGCRARHSCAADGCLFVASGLPGISRHIRRAHGVFDAGVFDAGVFGSGGLSGGNVHASAAPASTSALVAEEHSVTGPEAQSAAKGEHPLWRRVYLEKRNVRKQAHHAAASSPFFSCLLSSAGFGIIATQLKMDGKNDTKTVELVTWAGWTLAHAGFLSYSEDVWWRIR